MVFEERTRLRRERLVARRGRVVVKRQELAGIVGRELAALSASEARALGRRYARLGELLARIDRRLA